eukprot:11013704-Alexandrium_andersonii.AAC.1
MSASLVGSEMCIRDSGSSSSERVLFGVDTGGKIARLPAGVTNSSHAPDTVSYTHLTLPTICSV